MKKFVVIMIALMMLMTATACAPKFHTYTKQGLVIEIDRLADVVACEDGEGNVWEFFGCEGWELGDIVNLEFNDLGTDTIYDDEIVEAK